MCGRYFLWEDLEDEEDRAEMRAILQEINERYWQSQPPLAAKIGEVFPSDRAPVLALERGRVAAGLMRWGFPKWSGKGVVINARAETAAEKPLFRDALTARRCVIPSAGFYEWTHPAAGAKEKYLIRHAGTSLLYMAGLYNRYRDDDGRPYSAYVILTVPANRSMAVLHDRMPVVLDGPQRELWLRDHDAALALLRQPNEETFDLRAV